MGTKLLAACVLVFIAAGTAYVVVTDPDASEGTVLRWVTDPNPARAAQIAQFERMNPGIHVNLDWTSGGLTKVLVQVSAGIGPDLIDVYTPGQLAIYANKNALLPMTKYVKKYNVDINMFWPQCQQWMIHGGEIYAFPTNCATTVMYYNKDVFRKYAVPFPDPNWTVDDFLATAKRLTIPSPDGRHYEVFGYYPWDWYMWVWIFGGKIFNNDYTRCTLDSPEAIEGMQFYYDLFYKYHVSPSPEDLAALSGAGGWGNMAGNKRFYMFGKGLTAMMEIGRWVLCNWRVTFPDLQFGCAPMPKGRTRANFFHARATAVSRDCKHPEQAFMFLKYLASPEYNRLIADDGDGIPANKSVAYSDVFLKCKVAHKNEVDHRVHLDVVPDGRVLYCSPYVLENAMTRIFNEERDKMINQLQSPEQTCRELTRRLNEEINKGLAEAGKKQLAAVK